MSEYEPDYKDYLERFMEYPICNLCGREIDEQEAPVCEDCAVHFFCESCGLEVDEEDLPVCLECTEKASK